MGRCSVDPYGRFESKEACIANCESGGAEVPSQCCHQNREDYILPEGCNVTFLICFLLILRPAK